MDPEIARLWERYVASRSPAVREKLILQYAPLVKYVASRVGVGMPNHVDHADLVSYGIFGLMDAIDRFEPERGFKFETYAITRIRGSIIDALRANDWVPRSVRATAKRINRAMEQLEARLQRTPTDAEVAAELDMSVDELADALQRVSLGNFTALDETLRGGDETVSVIDTIEDTAFDTPEESLDDEAMRNLLARELDDLDERERQVVGLYYFEGMTLSQIGDILGVTESRVCQIHGKIVKDLRKRLTARIRG